MDIAARYHQVIKYLEQPISIAPLVVLRVVFGLLMLFSTLRYIAMGWVETQLIEPVLHFSYYGFEWVNPLPGNWMYLPFAIMIASSITITMGAYYRLSTILFFVCFTYIELIDITYYLNHYYFVSIIAFLLILVPANRLFSLDVKRNPSIRSRKVSSWCIDIFKFQIAIVYLYAGLAKVNYDWLIHALPLSIWLPAKSSLPVIGGLFTLKATAYVFSWLGMLFDTLVVFGLLRKKSRWFSYIAVVVFHAITGILFQIGIFPLVMIFAVIIFFSESFHQRLLNALNKVLTGVSLFDEKASQLREQRQPGFAGWKYALLSLFFLFQVFFPWRYLLYPGNVFWTEEGYRFAWRVMLMEKAGTATFYVKDGENGREGSVINGQFLNMHQEKQMAMQPDLMLQYAHYLDRHYSQNGMKDPIVRVESYVTLNAQPARLLIDPTVDLTQVEDQWTPKDWILPYSTQNRD